MAHVCICVYMIVSMHMWVRVCICACEGQILTLGVFLSYFPLYFFFKPSLTGPVRFIRVDQQEPGTGFYLSSQHQECKHVLLFLAFHPGSGDSNSFLRLVCGKTLSADPFLQAFKSYFKYNGMGRKNRLMKLHRVNINERQTKVTVWDWIKKMSEQKNYQRQIEILYPESLAH